MDFNAYVAQFNEGDEPKLGELFFTPDIIFDGGNRRFEGRKDVVEYLHNVAIGLKQVMTPIKVLHTDDHVMAEMNIEFIPSEDKPDFPLGPLRAGESFTLRFFGSYYLDGDRIKRIHLGNWAEPIDGRQVEP